MFTLRRCLFIAGLLALCVLTPADRAWAANSTHVSMNFADIVPMAGQGGQAGCEVALTGECGQGQVVPFGHATETTVFSTCGPDCLTPTITLAGGTLIIEKTHAALYIAQGTNACSAGCTAIRTPWL